ncbi:MaoC family dehydratase [Nocardioides perillae]|uniref:Acyl dehydratase n=1 Tax=Nocardioides perillae TaxID=1119534 RepID=A0A7Y9RW36_9ACTN|nr:MaoC/PaaZ C-terminal domain-containing protein [Nocardioides perillae]NYG55727.1 acyl dehydratase [Nocardioides perillae]
MAGQQPSGRSDAAHPDRTVLLEQPPGSLSTLVRAALPTVPVVGSLPGVRKGSREDFAGLSYARHGVRLERDHVEAYAAVCGFPVKDTVPVTYPHMAAFPLHMAIMTDRAFPYPAIGTVHVENAITAHRAIGVGEVLDVAVQVSPARPHAKGVVLDFRTQASADGELVWESTSTYLRRGKSNPDAPTGLVLEDVPAGSTRWSLPGDLGRRYGAVSGDRNPIHLYPLTAKALGFPRQIAHGMWSKARCIAALENRLPGAVSVEVSFRKPVLLPGTVAFGARPSGEGWAFSLSSRSGSAHLLGRTTPA